MLSITTIADPSIKLVASKRLCEFVKSLSGDSAMPENIVLIYNSNRKDCSQGPEKFTSEIENIKYTKEEQNFLKDLDGLEKEVEIGFTKLLGNDCEESDDPETSEEDDKTKKKKNKKKNKPGVEFLIELKDVKWLNKTLEKMRENGESITYLHELLEECKLILPENEAIERNPVLEARCQKLKREQEERMYHKMTKNVDNYRKHLPEDTISYQLNQINKQLIAVAQFVVSVLAGFAFGFIGVELIVGDLDFGFRLLLGIIIALTIALAEIYFLAKKLNEDADMIDEAARKINSGQMNNEPIIKEHND